ncbi:hypothetical protein COLO4_29059 [Corchorus olitorius]|uniref:Uncharacterized protein n=1 Tax=Corchorus olitorius TaxID=93759 RepID=A0A1R3HGH5_9ROSI|nr:hypothetical protein COLO4_29059 [Corchorus olitorius]
MEAADGYTPLGFLYLYPGIPRYSSTSAASANAYVEQPSARPLTRPTIRQRSSFATAITALRFRGRPLNLIWERLWHWGNLGISMQEQCSNFRSQTIQS